MTKLKLCLLFVALVLSLSGPIYAQERAGGIEGTVSDATGARVAGATVTITSLSGDSNTAGGTTSRPTSTTGFTRTITTDEEGFYRALEIPPGFFVVSVSAVNFRPVRQEGVEVVLGRSTPVNFAVEAGGVTEEVVVQASDVSAVDTTDSKIQTNITEQIIELIPKGVNFTTALQVSPATRNEPLAGGFQVDGASGSENAFIIDGTEVTNFRTGTLNNNNNIPFEFVQEIQVKSNGFEAEFGGATGGVVNVVTKSGNNDFNGEFGLQFETSKLFARTIRGVSTGSINSPIILAPDVTQVRYLQPQGDSFLNTYPTGNLGGPIIKNRLFFFASYNLQQLNTSRNFTFRDGTSTIYRQKIRQDYGFVRVDSPITSKLNVSGTYTYNPRKINGLLPAIADLDPISSLATLPSTLSSAVNFEQGGRIPAQSFTYSAVYVPTSNLLLSFRGGRSYLNEKGTGSYGVPNVVNVRCQGAPDPNGSCRAGFALGPIGFNSINVQDISIRNTVDADASYLVSNFGGRHQFKGGYFLSKVSNDANNSTFDTGRVDLFYGQTIADAGGVARGGAAGESGYGFLQRNGTFGAASSQNQGLYIQDSYQPFDRLTLNVGVRLEQEDVPNFSTAGSSINFGFGDKVAPRLGFALDPTGGGRLKIFASYGRFFDRFRYELPRGSFGGEQFLRDYFVIRSDNTNFNRYTRDYALANTFLQRNFRVPANEVNPDNPNPINATANAVDPDLMPFRQTEFTVGTEYALRSDIALAARYTHKQVDVAVEDVGVPRASDGSEFYFIANPGFGIVNQALISGVPPTAKAQRDYDALEVRVDKRFTRNYYLNASYTYSRLFGNYPGLASSDEAGRNSPNVNRVFDLPFEAYTPDGVPNNGRLGTDRPHAFKFFGAYTLDYGQSNNSTEISGFTTLQSGTPQTSRVDLLDVTTVALFGRGDLGRTQSFNQTDLALRHKYRFGEDNRFTVSFDINVTNAFNQNRELDRVTDFTATDGGVVFGEADFGTTNRPDSIRRIFNGGVTNIITSAATADPTIRDARYNRTDFFQVPRQVRFGFRFLF